MVKKSKSDIFDLLLEGHRKGLELAIDTSIRTGVPLVVMKNGKITYIKPKFKYVRVPISTAKRKKTKSA